MKKSNKLGTKKVIAFLVMLSLIMSSGTFAYWANYVEGTETEVTSTLEVGRGNRVETVFELSNEINTGGYLVPVGQVNNSDEGAVEAINVSFDVEWVEDEETTQMLGVEAVGQIEVKHRVNIYVDGKLLQFEGNENIYDLVNVLYNESNKTELQLDAAAETFSFTITLDEPANQEEYSIISEASISVTFSYEISTDEIEATDVVAER